MIRKLMLCLAFTALYCSAADAVTFDWVTVGNPNKADKDTGYGGVGYAYRITKYEVTNAQYIEYLNAVDPTGIHAPSGLYPSAGIEKTGAVDGARYVVKAGQERKPVNYVSFFEAMRFVNWLHNGQGVGGTESGVYTISDGFSETRSANARFSIPSMDEWYKAAYYDPSGVYYDYPTRTNTAPYSDDPSSLNAPDISNVANIYRDDLTANGYDDGHAVGGADVPGANPLTDVGAYTQASGPYGTFDQCGNVSEWNEAVFYLNGSPFLRGLAGGDFLRYGGPLPAGNLVGNSPWLEYEGAGFRVAASIVPEPGSFVLAALGMVMAVLRPI